MKLLIVLAIALAPICLGQEKSLPKFPEPEVVLKSMKKATAFYRSNLSIAGGYASTWSRDLKQSKTESSTGTALISIQPHGTTTVGLAMLRAHAITDDPLFLQAAKEAADALAWCQLSSGGWGSEFDFKLGAARKMHFRRDLLAGDILLGKRYAPSTLDDNKTQSAIRFLMEFSEPPEALAFAWSGLLAAQASNGGWPQRFSGPADPTLPVEKASYPQEWPRTFPSVDYTIHYALNDNNLEHLMDILLAAHRQENMKSSRFLDAAKQLGDFLLLAQMPEPQPAWAQQYNQEMHPAWARKFEPPSVCSIESVGAMRTLIEIWLVTGEEKYIAPLPAALKWFERSELESEEDTWSRFYELQTNKPLYCQAETYEIIYDDANLPTHYGFKVSGSMARTLEKIGEIISQSRDENLAKRERDSRDPDSEKGWSEEACDLASKARGVLKSQKKEGYWINKDNQIDAGEFVKSMARLTEYFEAATHGGETFAAVRKKEAAKEAVIKKAAAEKKAAAAAEQK
ncbi:pectate lyase [Verrucomicrobiales bacterium]|nr:pectate lyase [Verrucomicrobiales bacterium]MDB4657136.1 pectate lyase [Verrucomicrobiales bacterium]MDC0258681.1 pectate lyase [Verrucomicrobiales bacterium]MDC0314284.1 pectate lyase [bacterium]